VESLRSLRPVRALHRAWAAILTLGAAAATTRGGR
jgi:hypothetical protein